MSMWMPLARATTSVTSAIYDACKVTTLGGRSPDRSTTLSGRSSRAGRSDCEFAPALAVVLVVREIGTDTVELLMMNEVAGIGVERHASLRATHPTFLCILTLEDGD